MQTFICKMALDSTDQALKTKNKLGYHRQSVACSHCRRRKIRCLPSPYTKGKCENCMRTGKNCHFLKVSDDDPMSLYKKSKKSRERAISFDETLASRFIVPPKSTQLQSMSDHDTLYHPSLSPTMTRGSSGSEDHHTQVQYYRQQRQPWPLRQAGNYSVSDTQAKRPMLRYRMTDPIQISRLRESDPVYDNKVYGQSVVYRDEIMQPPSTQTHSHVATWPAYGIVPYGSDMHSSRTSERSSSYEAIGQVEHVGLTPWSPSPVPTTLQPPSAFHAYVPVAGQDHDFQDRAGGPPMSNGYPYVSPWNNP